MVHANGYLPVKLAVEAGCDSIEHGFFMAGKTCAAWPIAAWLGTHGRGHESLQDYLSAQGHRSDPSFAEVSRKNLEHQLEQISLARQLGVTLAVGT